MDDLNAIAEHAFFKNGPANKDSRFRVENPHLVCIILTHMEEMVALLDKEQSIMKDRIVRREVSVEKRTMLVGKVGGRSNVS